MEWLRRPFRTFALISLIIAVMPYWRQVTMRGLPDGKTETKNIFTLGIPPSPLFYLERSHGEQVRDTGMTTSFSWSCRLEFLSLSMLALILGAVLLVADRWRGRSPEPIFDDRLDAPSSDGRV
jgi:hypothetical protein